MNEWKNENGKYWYLPLPPAENTSAAEVQIHPVDEFTRSECDRYGVQYDAGARYGLFIKHDEPIVEYVLDSLHRDLGVAKQAGEKWRDSYAARIDKTGRYA